MQNIDMYQAIIRELEMYYNTVKYYIFLEFKYFSTSTMEIDFNNDFEIKENQNRFIDYNYDNNKFTLSMSGGLKRYNELKDRVLLKPIDVKSKMSLQYFKAFSLEDRAGLLNYFDKNFNEVCYSEFLQAYMKKLINITSDETFVAEDFLGEYKERKGYFFNEVLAEVKIRSIAKKSGLFYLPETGFDNEILRDARLMLGNEKTWRIILMGNINNLINQLNLVQAKRIENYEYACFEKKYKLPSSYFENDFQEKLIFRSIKARKEDLKNKLRMILNSIAGNGSSPGFTSILMLLIWYIMALGLGYFITKLLLGS